MVDSWVTLSYPFHTSRTYCEDNNKLFVFSTQITSLKQGVEGGKTKPWLNSWFFFFTFFFFLVGLYPNAKITIIKNSIFDPIKTHFLLFIHTDNSTVPFLFFIIFTYIEAVRVGTAVHQNLTCIFNWILIVDIKDFRTNFSCLSTHPFVQSWAGVSFLQSSLCGAVFYISDSNTWIMAKQCFIQHQGLPFLSEYTVGFVGVWEGTQPARWPKLTRGTPCHIMPCSAIKRGFRKVTHRLPGYWQCISLLMGGSGFSLHHMVCFLSLFFTY